MRALWIPAMLVGLVAFLPHALAAPPCGTQAACDNVGDAPPPYDVVAAWVSNEVRDEFDIVLELDAPDPTGFGTSGVYEVRYCVEPTGYADVCYAVTYEDSSLGPVYDWYVLRTTPAGTVYCDGPSPSAVVYAMKYGTEVRWRMDKGDHQVAAPPGPGCSLTLHPSSWTWPGGTVSCMSGATYLEGVAVDEGLGCPASPTWTV